MCRCAARGCKRRVRKPAFDVPREQQPPQHLCYPHSWWYANSHQSEYVHMSNAGFPVWSAGDIATWLSWIGL